MVINNLLKKRILIVDDDSASLLLLNEILAEFEYNILSTGNGYSALKILQEQSVDLVLLDIKLPDISGFTVLDEVKNKYDHQIKVIVQTAYKYENNKFYLDVGFDDYIKKPYNAGELIEKINKVLKQQSY